VKYNVSIESARKTYHHAEQRIYKLLQDLDSGKRDLTYWKRLTEAKSGKMRQDVRIFLMNYVFELTPTEIQKILNIKSLSYVSRQIRKIADQLKAGGELSLIEATPEESAEAKARLDTRRKKRRERQNNKKSK
jgi:hypothetical protein